MLRIVCAGLLALALGLAQAPQKTPVNATAPAKKSALDKVAFENYVRHLKLFVPAVKLEISDPAPAALAGFQEVKVRASMGQQSLDEVYYVSADGQKIIEGRVYDVNQSPFAGDLAKLNAAYQPAMGPPGAPVQIVLFSDFECHYCREEAKALRENLPKSFPNEVRLAFKDLPLEAIHPWARPAANAGRCVFRQNALAFWEYHDWIFEKQPEIKAETVKAQILEWAKTKPALNQEQFAACVENGGGLREVEKNMADARALGLNSTPVMFVNGRKLAGSVAWPQLKQIIELELDFAKKNPAPAVAAPGKAKEECCSLELKPFGGK
jgi:protein-disulfide isomerase